jgi:hypothetical protein
MANGEVRDFDNIGINESLAKGERMGQIIDQ